jgi:hypothetical protein
MAAAQGASLKELMERMGHSSPRAALIYQHATRERDQKIAAGYGQTVRRGQESSEERGTKGRWSSFRRFPQLSEKVMDRRERNGDAKIPGHIIMTHEDVDRAALFIPPNGRLGAGANLKRAPLDPVRLLDARELPEFVGGGPDVQFPCLALQLDHAGIIDIVTSLNGDVHHGPMLAAQTTRDKPKPLADQGDRTQRARRHERAS